MLSLIHPDIHTVSSFLLSMPPTDIVVNQVQHRFELTLILLYTTFNTAIWQYSIRLLMHMFKEIVLHVIFFFQGQRHGDGYRIPIAHHLFLNLKNFTYNSINEDVEVFFSLYDARENKCIR